MKESDLRDPVVYGQAHTISESENSLNGSDYY